MEGCCIVSGNKVEIENNVEVNINVIEKNS